jgi:hypothetical protein
VLLDLEYRAIHPDVREDYLRRRHSWKFWQESFEPFHNEHHFNRAVVITIDQLGERAATFDWEHERQQDEETIVVAEIIDVLMREVFPDFDPNSVTYRIALRFVVMIVVRRLHDRMKDSELAPNEYQEQVRRWSTQARNL